MESSYLEKAVDYPDLTMKKDVKKLVVVKYDCKEYANRLWNDVAIYAAGREIGATVHGPSVLQRLKVTRWLYEIWAQIVGRLLHAKDSVWAWGGTVRYLPPTIPLPEKYESSCSLYLLGMLFRNPKGFEIYADEIRTRFRAHGRIKKLLENKLTSLSGRILIGVEIRQRPFTYFPDGEFLIPLTRTEDTVREYMQEQGLSADDIGLVICSDEPVPDTFLSDISSVRISGNARLTFHALTYTKAILGTNASTSNLSAWLANVPHLVTTIEPIDWEYYKDKLTFFENKYATLTQPVSVR